MRTQSAHPLIDYFLSNLIGLPSGVIFLNQLQSRINVENCQLSS